MTADRTPSPTDFAEWHPPFCANEIENLACPKCGEEAVRVREQDVYFEGDVEAYCGECHALLEVQASVEVTFTDPEVQS